MPTNANDLLTMSPITDNLPATESKEISGHQLAHAAWPGRDEVLRSVDEELTVITLMHTMAFASQN